MVGRSGRVDKAHPTPTSQEAGCVRVVRELDNPQGDEGARTARRIRASDKRWETGAL